MDITAELVQSKVPEFKDGMIKFAQKLIQTNSISSHEKGVADLYLAEMEKLGYDTYFRDDFGNVIGMVKGTDPGPTIMYNSHMDHVGEGDVNNWEGYDPYGGLIDVCEVDNQEKTQKEMSQCIHGRAASDVKGGGAVQIYAGGILAALKKEGYKMKGTFMFTGVVLEEPAENIGMQFMLKETFPKYNLDYDCLISSEATSLKLYLGHRGRTEYLVTTYGRTSHGSAPWLGINAVYKAIPYIYKVKDELYPTLPTDPVLGQSSIALTIIECSPGALSIVPDKCMMSFDRRTIPGEKAEDVLKQFQDIIDELSAKDPEFKATVEIKYGHEPTYTGRTLTGPKYCSPWKIEKDHPFVKAAAEGLKAVGQDVKYDYWVFGTDLGTTAGIYKKPSIGYSPMQEQFAHTPYDKVRTDFMEKALAGNVSIFLSCTNSKEDISAPIE